MLLLRGDALGVALNGAPLLPLLLAVLHQLTPAYHDSLVYGKLAVFDDTVSHKLLLTHLLPSSDVQGDEETVAAPVVTTVSHFVYSSITTLSTHLSSLSSPEPARAIAAKFKLNPTFPSTDEFIKGLNKHFIKLSIYLTTKVKIIILLYVRFSFSM